MEKKRQIGYKVFPVNNRPCCLWSFNQKAELLEFLQSINPQYFSYLAGVHSPHLSGTSEHKADAAIALRFAYLHGLETLFSLLVGTLQAPHAIHAWIQKCSTSDLHDIVAAVHQRKQELLHMLPVDEVSWLGLSKVINSIPFPAEVRNPVERFAELWEQLASELIADANRFELNSIKHGFRIKLGGFGLNFKDEKGTETAFPTSEYGTQFFVTTAVDSAPKENLSIQRWAINWNPQVLQNALIVISVSINNIVSYLRLANGDKGSLKAQFPIGDDLLKAITKSDGTAHSITFGETVKARNLGNLFSNDELRNMIRRAMVKNTGASPSQ